MKIEVKLDQKESNETTNHTDAESGCHGQDEASIDIAQVLAANQALMKNLLLKVDSMERRLRNMEGTSKRQLRQARLGIEQRKALAAPPKEIQAWEPEYPRLDERYLSSFSFLETFFFPENMRRKGVEESL
jgi:hypothetical protein